MCRMVRILSGIVVLLLLIPVVGWAQGDLALQRKAALVDQFLKDSDTSRRIAAKGNREAAALLDLAKQAREAARKAMVAGDEAQGKLLLDKALQLVAKASRTTVDPASQQWIHRAKHEDLLISVANFKDAYSRHLQRLQAGSKGPLDLQKVDTLQSQGVELGKKKNFIKANEMLTQAHEMVVKGLSSLLGSTALIYELKFDTPKDEYEYELKRGESYEVLIRMVFTDGNAHEVDEAQLRPLLDNSQEANGRASEKAMQGEFADAIKIQEEANNFLAQALRMLGVMIPL